MPGTTNFLVWNPLQNNQETDGNYAADAQRVNGATDPSIFLSTTANKLFYQVTTFVAALANALAAKGYSPTDAVLGTLQTIMAQFLTQIDFAPLAYTGATPAYDLGLSPTPVISQTLTANISPTVINTTVPGQRVIFILTQDATGGRTVTWPANVKGAGAPDPAPNSVNIQEFINLGGNLRPLTGMTSS